MGPEGREGGGGGGGSRVPKPRRRPTRASTIKVVHLCIVEACLRAVNGYHFDGFHIVCVFRYDDIMCRMLSRSNRVYECMSDEVLTGAGPSAGLQGSDLEVANPAGAPQPHPVHFSALNVKPISAGRRADATRAECFNCEQWGRHSTLTHTTNPPTPQESIRRGGKGGGGSERGRGGGVWLGPPSS